MPATKATKAAPSPKKEGSKNIADQAKPKKTTAKKSENAASVHKITIGALAPEFILPGSDDQKHKLSAYRGKNVVIYFYPKDDTPGCTVEAQDFRQLSAGFAKKNAIILGVSKDTIASHCKFRDKYDLNFVLLSDPDCAVMQAYGAYGEKTLYGKVSIGTIRSTVWIKADGTVGKAWRQVKVNGHAHAVLEAVQP